MILLVAGRMASGKTTLARALANRLGGSRVGFGDFVRHLATEAGLDADDRRTLQDLGQRRVEAGADAFVEDLLAFVGPRGDGFLVVDGLRHGAVLDAFRRRTGRTGEPVCLIFVDLAEGERSRRLLVRGSTAGEAAAVEAHPVEIGPVRELRAVADLVVDGGAATEASIARVSSFLAASPPATVFGFGDLSRPADAGTAEPL